jgi:hypothetical protein
MDPTPITFAILQPLPQIDHRLEQLRDASRRGTLAVQKMKFEKAAKIDITIKLSALVIPATGASINFF